MDEEGLKIEMQDESGKKYLYDLVGMFLNGEQQYGALLLTEPEDLPESGTVQIFRMDEDQEGYVQFSVIEDEQEYEEALGIFNRLINDRYDQERGDEDNDGDSNNEEA